MDQFSILNPLREFPNYLFYFISNKMPMHIDTVFQIETISLSTCPPSLTFVPACALVAPPLFFTYRRLKLITTIIKLCTV